MVGARASKQLLNLQPRWMRDWTVSLDVVIKCSTGSSVGAALDAVTTDDWAVATAMLDERRVMKVVSFIVAMFESMVIDGENWVFGDDGCWWDLRGASFISALVWLHVVSTDEAAMLSRSIDLSGGLAQSTHSIFTRFTRLRVSILCSFGECCWIPPWDVEATASLHDRPDAEAALRIELGRERTRNCPIDSVATWTTAIVTYYLPIRLEELLILQSARHPVGCEKMLYAYSHSGGLRIRVGLTQRTTPRRRCGIQVNRAGGFGKFV